MYFYTLFDKKILIKSVNLAYKMNIRNQKVSYNRTEYLLFPFIGFNFPKKKIIAREEEREKKLN